MENSKSAVRQRADEIKNYQCKNLVVVLENPMDIKNVGSVIRNANALGVETIYVVDSPRPTGKVNFHSQHQIVYSIYFISQR
jgi:tRNA G18 (ribose-2'-O)-methylase SpoU